MGYLITIVILAGINIVAVLGVAILTGYTGLFTIGHAGFMALGGYMSAIMVKELHVPFPLALLIGGTFAGLCSFIIGYPAFRSQLRGDYFAIATLGFSEAIRLLLNNTRGLGESIKNSTSSLGQAFQPAAPLLVKLGGAFGYMNLPNTTNVIVVVVTVALALFFAHMFVTSQYGKNSIAVSQDEVAAQMMGVNLLKTKLISLFISAFYAGVAGGLLGFYFAYLSPSLFTITKSSDLLAAVVFGGVQSLIGPFITAFVLIGVPEVLRAFAEWRLIVYGFLFVIVMIFRPQGLLGYVEMNFERYITTKGRMSRKEWWVDQIPLALVLLIIYVGLSNNFSISSLLLISPWVALILAAQAVISIKRFHDLDRSGWYYLLALIPGIGSLILTIWLGFIKGNEGENRFGPPPSALRYQRPKA